MFFNDKFGSVLKCIGKPKVAAGRGEWVWPSSRSLLYFYCNLICELLHVLIINPKDLEVHSLGSTPGHTTIFELALLINSILCGWILIYPKYFVCLFVCLFVCSFLHFLCGYFLSV